MSTSKAQAHFEGFEAAVNALFDLAIECAICTEKRRKLDEKFKLLASENYSVVRRLLDEQPETFLLTRTMAQFFLGVSPKVFNARLKLGPHPFSASDKVPKAAVLDWFRGVIEEKHRNTVNSLKNARWGRDPNGGCPYLIDTTGVVVGDGDICGVAAEDVAMVMQGGGEIRIMRLEAALELPWRKESDRVAWATGYRRWLVAYEGHLVEQIKKLDQREAHRSIPDAQGIRDPDKDRL